MKNNTQVSVRNTEKDNMHENEDGWLAAIRVRAVGAVRAHAIM